MMYAYLLTPVGNLPGVAGSSAAGAALLMALALIHRHPPEHMAADGVNVYSERQSVRAAHKGAGALGVEQAVIVRRVV